TSEYSMRLHLAARSACAIAVCVLAAVGGSGEARSQQPAPPERPAAQQSPAQDPRVRQPSDQLPRGEKPAVPPSAAEITRGEALLGRHCASCHAVGRSGTSPHVSAPAFRTLSQRYKIEALEEALAEGLSSGHPDMPEFTFETD